MKKKELGWNITVELMIWSEETVGYLILIQPDGSVAAWPVFSEKECIQPIGNLLKEDIRSIWEKYPYKDNHVKSIEVMAFSYAKNTTHAIWCK